VTRPHRAGPEGPAHTCLIAAIVLAAVWIVPASTQERPPVKDVMRRVEQYVASYGERASIVVGTERYTQATARSTGDRGETRTLTSDFAIVKADAIRGWLGFRDVLAVDGTPIADREDRLARVLMASEGRYDEAQRLSNESARYNIGSIERNFNVPTTMLFFFVPDNHDRFRFSARGGSWPSAADGAYEIRFNERSRPSLIRTPEGRSILTSGTIEVAPDSGVVLRTVLVIDDKDGTTHGLGRIDVRYARVASLDMWLPESMEESFEMAPRKGVWSRVTGNAEYSNYRQFTTSGRIK
jgi:hypothetical protein